MHIIYVVALILLVMWAFGAVFHVAGGLIHLLLLIALIMIVVRLLGSRRGGPVV